MIEAVREFSCIWQLSNRSYKDLRAKENAWKAVVAKVQIILPSNTYINIIVCAIGVFIPGQARTLPGLKTNLGKKKL